MYMSMSIGIIYRVVISITGDTVYMYLYITTSTDQIVTRDTVYMSLYIHVITYM